MIGSTNHDVIIAIASMVFGLWLFRQLREEIRSGVPRVGMGYGHPGKYFKNRTPFQYGIGIAIQASVATFLLFVGAAYLAIQFTCMAMGVCPGGTAR